jgi:hypothetical protein
MCPQPPADFNSFMDADTYRSVPDMVKCHLFLASSMSDNCIIYNGKGLKCAANALYALDFPPYPANPKQM